MRPANTWEMEISHSRGPVRGHRGAAGIGSLRYHWRLLLDANLLLIPQLSRGLEYIPIRLDFNHQYLGRHDTKHPLLQIYRHRAGRGSGKYLPSEAPVYPPGAVTSGWTPFNIYPCGFHRSATQARQTLLIKTGACFKGPHSGRQSALAGQKSPGHVAAGKPEMDVLFQLHFPSSSFSTTTIPGSKSRQRTCGKLRCSFREYSNSCKPCNSTLRLSIYWSLGPHQTSGTWIIYQRQDLDGLKNMVLLDASDLVASDCDNRVTQDAHNITSRVFSWDDDNGTFELSQLKAQFSQINALLKQTDQKIKS